MITYRLNYRNAIREHREIKNRFYRNLPSTKWPHVTIQLPIYNERYVVERLIESICRLDYPKHLLEIQVLDDSTDDTVKFARFSVEKMKARGFDIVYLHRQSRSGYKAGALKAGLDAAGGDLIAIFDADFVPDRTFLKETIPYFTDPKVGMLQTRWGHLNSDYSMLTRIQSIVTQNNLQDHLQVVFLRQHIALWKHLVRSSFFEFIVIHTFSLIRLFKYSF